MGNSSVWLNFHENIKNKLHHNSSEDHLEISNTAKFAKQRSRNIVKFGRNRPASFVCILYYDQKVAPLLSRKWCKFSCVIQKYRYVRGQYFFRTLQHFATKLCNITKFKMLFLAIVIYLFVHLALAKFQQTKTKPWLERCTR